MQPKGDLPGPGDGGGGEQNTQPRSREQVDAREVHHDLGTFQIGAGAGPSQAGRSTVGLYHLAWEVDTLAEMARIRGLLIDRGALSGASDHITTKALYAKDPDGIEFEVSWIL